MISMQMLAVHKGVCVYILGGRGASEVGLSESVEKGNLTIKLYFSDNFE